MLSWVEYEKSFITSGPDLHNINTHTMLLKIHWYLLTLLSGNENTDRHHMTDRQTDTLMTNMKP